jgi:hypothetical protein
VEAVKAVCPGGATALAPRPSPRTAELDVSRVSRASVRAGGTVGELVALNPVDDVDPVVTGPVQDSVRSRAADQDVVTR